MPVRFARIAAALLMAAAHVAAAQAPDRLVLSTDWFAEAEHGGFYQAVAEGIYRRHGLDVVVQMGGPQVNGLQLAAAGRIDIAMGDALQVLAVSEQHVPLVAIAATFQKNPTVIIAHPGVASLADLKGKPIAVGAASNTTFWPWLKKRYGFNDALRRFIVASAEGWQSYLADPAPGNALIRKANPQMTDELLAYGYRKMKEYRLVDGGEAMQHGLLSMTDARWQASVAFIRDAGIAKPGVDYTQAWTTALSLDTRAPANALPPR